MLRWKLVERGYALTHGACIAFEGTALLITARTDTGKTTTTLRVMDAHPYQFVSDDMTIVSADGAVRAYPKPLTISKHTVGAVRKARLSRRERWLLPLQSRVHSKSSRRFALWLSKVPVPFATINALVQIVVPPPKYHIERLIPAAQTTARARLGGLVVLQRGGIGDEAISTDDALDVLMANSEDAYGVPPYEVLRDYLLDGHAADLAALEREIIGAAITGAPALVLRSETKDWAERLPKVAEWMRLPVPGIEAVPAVPVRLRELAA
jgi:hypothetical protein